MKWLILKSLYFVILSGLFYNLNAQVYNVYGTSGNDYSQSGTQISDGSFALFGNSVVGSNQQATIIRLDSNHKLLYSLNFGGNSTETGIFTVSTLDSGYVVTGSTNSNGGGGYDIFVIKFNKTDQIEWQYTYGGSRDEVPNEIIQTNDSGYIVTGYARSYGHSTHNVYVLKIKKDGSVDWARSLYTSTIDYGSKSMQFGNSFYVTSTSNYSNVFGYGDVFLTKFDSIGRHCWTKAFGAQSNENANKILRTLDNKIAMTFHSVSFSSSGQRELFFLKLDTSGSVIFNQIIQESGNAVDGYDFIQTKDSNFYVTGSYKTLGCIIKLNKNGGIIWGKYTDISSEATLWQIQQTKNNKIAAYGNAVSLGTGDYDYLHVASDTACNVSCLEWSPFYPVSKSQSISNQKENSYFSIDTGYNKRSLSWNLSKDTVSIVRTMRNIDTSIHVNLADSSLFCSLENIKIDCKNNSINDITYLWNTGDTTSYIYPTKFDFYYLQLLNPDGNCFNFDTTQIVQITAPSISLPLDTCHKDSLVLSPIFHSNSQYLWNTLETTTEITARNTGFYSVKITDTLTNCISYDTVYVNVLQNSVVSIQEDSIQDCFNQNYQKISAIGSWGNTSDFFISKQWFVNDTFSDTGSVFIKTHISPGRKNIKLYIESHSGCADTAYYSYYINPSPVSRFVVSDSVPCFEGNKIMVTDSGKIASGTYSTYWDLGDGTDTSLVSSFYKPYAISDTFKITQVLISDSGCSDTSFKNIRVKESPVAQFTSNNNSQCLKGNDFRFTNTTVYSDTTKMNYIWTATNKGAIFTKNLTLNYTSDGTKQVQLISYSNESCFDTINMNIRINPNPVAGFIRNDTLQCLFSNNLKLDDTSKISSGGFKTDFYFGDGISALNKDTVSHIYAAYGLYNLKQMVTSDSGCRDSAAAIIDIVENPVNKLVIDKNSTCFNGHVFNIKSGVFFKQNTPGITFDFGDGKTLSDTFNGSYSYQKYGHYLVKINSKNRICEDHDSVLVHVNPNPIAGFTRNDSLQCLFENSLKLNDTSKVAAGSVSANWYFGDGNSKLNSDTLSYHYTTYGLHTLKLVSVSDSGCKDSAFLTTDIVQNPVNKLSVDTGSLCFKGNIFDVKSGVVLTQASPIITFSLGDNNNFNDSFNGTHSYADTGTYYIKMNSKNRMCEDRDSLKIRVNVHPDFYVPTDTCSEDSLVFSVKYSPDWKYQWSHGDTNNSIKLFNTGWYKLIATNRYTNCKTTDSMKVDFGEVPIVTITIDSLRKCLDDNTLQITSNISIRGIKDSLRVRVWYVNDVAIDSTDDVFNYIHNSFGKKRIKVRAESWKTCKSFANFDYYVNPNPVAGFVVNDTLSCFEHHLIDLKDTGKIAEGKYGVLWDFGDGTDTSGPVNIQKKYASYDIYHIKEILTSDSGCRDSIQKTIRIKESPIASFVLNGNNSQCLKGNDFDFSNTSSVANGGLKYAWNKGDLSGIDTNKNIHYSYQKFGTYPVLLEVTSDENCKDSAAMVLRVNPNPDAGFTINDALQCSDINSVLLTDTSLVDTGSYVNSFYFGDGFNKVGMDTVSHHYSTYGLFNIKQIVTSDSGCLDSAFAMADIVEMPVNNLSTDKNSACLNGHVFNIRSGVLFKQNAPNILFSYGDGNTLSDSFDGQYSFQKFGTYTLKISSQNRICKDEDSVVVRVNPNPKVGFICNDTSQCLFENNIILNDTSSIDFGSFTNDFYFGDGVKKLNVDTVSHHYNAYGLFDIKQIATSDSGCLDSAFTVADIVENPVNSLIIPDVSECIRGNVFNIKSDVTFKQNTPIKTFDFGNGNILSDTFNGTYSYTNPGKYFVKISSQNRICLDKDSIEVYVNPSPDAGFTMNDSLQCIQGNVYDLTDTTSILYGNFTRTWTMSDATKYTTRNVQKTFKSFGGFDIRLNVVSDSGCTDSAFKSIHVMEMPSLEFMVNDIGQCFKTNDFKLAYLSKNLRYTNINWDMADGTTFSGDTSFNHSYASFGNYQPKLVVKNEVCSDSLSFNLFVNPEPTAALSLNNPEQCFNGHEFIFDDNSTIPSGNYSASLSLGDNTTNSPFSSYNYKYAVAKNYNLKLKVVSDSACSDSVVQLVKVFESPDASIWVNDSDQCFNGNLFNLKLAKKPIVNGTYATDWYLNDGTGFTGVDSAKHSFARFGNYTSQAIVTTGDNCKDTATRNLFAHPSPNPGFSVKSVCFPEPSEFINSSKIDSGTLLSYNWLIDNAASYNSKDVTHAFNTTGSFDASLSVTSDKGCTETIVINNIVFVNPKPSASFVFAELEDDQPEITWQFTSTSSGGTDYEWFFSDGFFETNQQFTRDFSSDTITLGISHIALSDSGCRDTAFKSAFISTQQAMYIPNAFTPGADDLNPVFKPIGVQFVIKYEFLVFNRWGEIMFQTNDINKGWDGTYKGVNVADGTFFYSINYIDIDKKRYTFKGEVVLLR